MIRFGNRCVQSEVKAIETPKAIEVPKAVSTPKAMPLFQTLFKMNSTFIQNGLKRDPPVKFTTEKVCQSILGALMADWVYEHIPEFLGEEDDLIWRNEAACVFITWAHHIYAGETCENIDFMVPNDYTLVIFNARERESLDAKVQAYLKDLNIDSFQKLLLEIAHDWERKKIGIDWKMFPDKKDPEKEYPHDFIQWIRRPNRDEGICKKYYRLTEIEPDLTCGRILDRTIRRILYYSH